MPPWRCVPFVPSQPCADTMCLLCLWLCQQEWSQLVAEHFANLLLFLLHLLLFLLLVVCLVLLNLLSVACLWHSMSKRNTTLPPYHNTVLVKYMCCAHKASTVNHSKIADASYFADEANRGVWRCRCLAGQGHRTCMLSRARQSSTAA